MLICMFECAAYTGTNYCHIASPSITCVRINLITKLGVLRECDQGLETRNGIKKNEEFEMSVRHIGGSI